MYHREGELGRRLLTGSVYQEAGSAIIRQHSRQSQVDMDGLDQTVDGRQQRRVEPGRLRPANLGNTLSSGSIGGMDDQQAGFFCA